MPRAARQVPPMTRGTRHDAMGGPEDAASLMRATLLAGAVARPDQREVNEISPRVPAVVPGDIGRVPAVVAGHVGRVPALSLIHT